MEAEASPPPDLTGFQRDCLLSISKLREPNGLDVKEKIEGVYETKINHGRLYPNLDELVRKGLVNKTEKDGRTNRYEVSSRGRRVIESYAKWTNE